MNRTARTKEGLDQPAITAIVVSCNEGHLLPACLNALKFCDELLVVDLQSEDNTRQVAESLGAKIIDHPRVPIVEQVRAYATQKAANDWILFVDPDTVFPAHRGEELKAFIAENLNVGVIRAYARNYFKSYPLKFGKWGGIHHCTLGFHRDRVNIGSTVHAGYQPRPGFTDTFFPLGDEERDLLAHYWVSSLWHLIAKHQRYLKHEGQSRYEQGQRFTWRKAFSHAFHQFKLQMLWKQGYRDGLLGVFLNLHWCWYQWSGWLALRRYEKTLPKIERDISLQAQQTEQRKAA